VVNGIGLPNGSTSVLLLMALCATFKYFSTNEYLLSCSAILMRPGNTILNRVRCIYNLYSGVFYPVLKIRSPYLEDYFVILKSS
jgi:ABC-type uncharacterized transport system permease subunit